MSKTRQEMAQRYKALIQKDVAETALYREQIQQDCTHRTADQWWDIGLQHNFPDRLTRGICLRCDLVISPRHWESAGPDEVKVVPAHPLYPVVVALEQQDYALATLRDVYFAAVNSLLAFNETRFIGDIDYLYARARAAIRKQCERDIEDTSAFSGAK